MNSPLQCRPKCLNVLRAQLHCAFTCCGGLPPPGIRVSENTCFSVVIFAEPPFVPNRRRQAGGPCWVVHTTAIPIKDSTPQDTAISRKQHIVERLLGAKRAKAPTNYHGVRAGPAGRTRPMLPHRDHKWQQFQKSYTPPFVRTYINIRRAHDVQHLFREKKMR